MKSYITCLTALAAAYAQLSADVSVSQGKGTIQNKTALIAKIRHFQELPILTESLPVSPDGNYQNIEKVSLSRTPILILSFLAGQSS